MNGIHFHLVCSVQMWHPHWSCWNTQLIGSVLVAGSLGPGFSSILGHTVILMRRVQRSDFYANNIRSNSITLHSNEPAREVLSLRQVTLYTLNLITDRTQSHKFIFYQHEKKLKLNHFYLQLSKVNTITLASWLKERGIPCKAKDKKGELVERALRLLNIPVLTAPDPWKQSHSL